MMLLSPNMRSKVPVTGGEAALIRCILAWLLLPVTSSSCVPFAVYPCRLNIEIVFDIFPILLYDIVMSIKYQGVKNHLGGSCKSHLVQNYLFPLALCKFPKFWLYEPPKIEVFLFCNLTLSCSYLSMSY